MLDSGAAVSAISNQFLKILQKTRKDKFLLFPAENHIKLTSIDKKQIHCSHFCIIPILGRHLIKFYVIEKLDHDLVLGLPALAALQAKMFFGKGKEKIILANRHIPVWHTFPKSKYLKMASVMKNCPESELIEKYKKQYPDIFSTDPESLPAARVPPIKLQLKPGSTNWKQKPYKLPIAKSEFLKKHLDKLCKQGVIEPCPVDAIIKYCSPVHLVKKPKTDPEAPDDFRMVVDVRFLNLNLFFSNGYMESAQSLFNALSGYSYFSRLDLKSGFHLCPLTEDSQLLTTFCTPFGLFYYKRLTMGLKTSGRER